MRTTNLAPPTNLTPLAPTIVVSRGAPMEIIHKRGAKEFQGSKEDDLIVAESWLS